MFAKKASQPSSLECLLLARLLFTRCHPPSSCKKGIRISKTSALQRVGGEVRNYMRVYVYVCDVCEHMCMHIHVCDKWTVMQLHILFECEVCNLDAQ